MKCIFNKPSKLVVFSLILMIYSTVSLWGQKYPLSVVDGKGNEVIVKQKPEKIISLGAGSTEILFKVGAGAQIAAVSDICNFPEEVEDIPQVGGFGISSISVESLLQYDPDLVIIYSGMHDYLIPRLIRYEIPYYVSDANSIDAVITEIKNLAYLTGHEQAGLNLEKEYTERLKKVQTKVSNSGKSKKFGRKIYWEIWYDPFMTAGKNSFINDVISAAGGVNIFGKEKQAYPVISEESIIAANPDYILIPDDIYMGTDVIETRRGWNGISAVKNHRVILFNADVYTRPGPRIFDAIEELNSILYE